MRAIQTTLVQGHGWTIGSGDHHHIHVKQQSEQSFHDHGIGDVRHLEFVKTQQLTVLRDGQGDGGDGVLLGVHFFKGMNSSMDVQHEFMKMGALLLSFGRHLIALANVKKQIHGHGFADPHTAVDVQSFWRRSDRGFELVLQRLFGLGQKTCEWGGKGSVVEFRFDRQLVVRQCGGIGRGECVVKMIQVVCQMELRWVGFDGVGGNELVQRRGDWAGGRCRGKEALGCKGFGTGTVEEEWCEREHRVPG